MKPGDGVSSVLYLRGSGLGHYSKEEVDVSQVAGPVTGLNSTL